MAKKKSVAAGLGGEQEEKTLEELQAEEEVSSLPWLHVVIHSNFPKYSETLKSIKGRIVKYFIYRKQYFANF